jgi:hypothetical protein
MEAGVLTVSGKKNPKSKLKKKAINELNAPPALSIVVSVCPTPLMAMQ